MKAAHLAMLLAWPIVACAPAQALDRRIEIFDAHAATSLPTRFSLPAPGNGAQQVTLLGKLHADVDTPSGRAAIFLAEVDGRPGTIVRLAGTLDIALDEDKDPSAALAGVPIDRQYGPETATPPLGLPRKTVRGVARGATDRGNTALDTWIFLHEQAGESDRAKFLNWYVGWWIKDLETNVKLQVPIRVSVHENVPGLTDLDYDSGTDVERIGEVARRGAAFARSRGAEPGALTKYVLFVDRPPANWTSGTLGSAVPQYGAAIVSNRGHRHIFAHEMGHLLGATHENAERGFFCITNMKDNLIGTFSCKYYSEANNELIRRHVRARSRM